MAAQDSTNEVTKTTEMGETRTEQECEICLASQRKAEELNADGPTRYEFYEKKEKAMKNLTEIIVSGIENMKVTIRIQDRLMAELVTERSLLQINIVQARKELSDVKKTIKERRLRYRNLFRRNRYIQSLLNEERSLLAELAKLKK